jgi:sugar diacid utilization regulator
MPIKHDVEDIVADLISLLHRNAAADEIAQRLVQAEALPDALPQKSRTIELVRMTMAVRNRLELQQQSERGMLAVIESAKDLSSHLDLNGLLHAIVTRARHLLGAQLTWLTAYESDRDEFRALVTEGATAVGTTHMTAGRNLGVAGLVMSTRLPFSTPDYLHDDRFPHDPVLDDTFRREGIEALVGVPLLRGDKVIGLLFVADRYPRTYTAANISILSTLATHAAVAINNATAFEQAGAALQRADLARAELQHHVRNVQDAAEAHEQLTSLLAKGATLGTLCQSVAQLLGGAVLVLDEASQVIGRGKAPGYGGTLADGYLAHGPRSAAIAQALRESRAGGRSVIAFDADGELCRVVAVIGGNDVLGAVLLFRHADLSEMSIRTYERSSSIIGIVLLSQERVEANKSRDVATLLRMLISTRQDEPALLAERAGRFGLDLTQPVSLLLIEMDELKPEFVARRLRSGGALADLLFDEVDGVLAIVCSATRTQYVLKETAAAAKREFGERYRGVVSRPVQFAAELPALYAVLRRALPVLGRIGIRGKIVAQNEMALYAVLFETHDQASLQEFVGASIGPVLAYDRKRGTALMQTLLGYLDNNQNARATAAVLGIHVNTVRQRLATLEELLGYWGHAERALEIHVAARLWSLSRSG